MNKLSILFVMVVLLTTTVIADGMGLSPATRKVTIEPGQEVTKTITAYPRCEGTSLMQVEIRKQPKGLNPDIFNYNTKVNGKCNEGKPITFKYTVPTETKVGVYKNYICVHGIKDQETGIGLSAGACGIIQTTVKAKQIDRGTQNAINRIKSYQKRIVYYEKVIEKLKQRIDMYNNHIKDLKQTYEL